MPRGRHRHSPPLHRLLPPSAIAGVSIVCALGPWVFDGTTVLRVLAAVAAVTTVTGAVVMRHWDRQAGKRVADLVRARAGDEWRFDERLAELESDLEESRELRTKLEQRLRAKRAELASLRNEHASLLRRYATAETERATALEGRRLLEIEAAPTAPALPAARRPEEAEPGARPEPGADPGAAGTTSVPGAFSPEGARLFLRAREALARLGHPADGEAAVGADAESGADARVGADARAGVAGVAGEAAVGDAAGRDDDGGGDDGNGGGESLPAAGPERDDTVRAESDGTDGHERAAAVPGRPEERPAPAAPESARQVMRPVGEPDGHFTVPTAVAVVPGGPSRRPRIEGGFDFFGTKDAEDGTAPPQALESVQNEDLADVVGQEALALHKAETEAAFKPAVPASPAVGQVIDLTAHDETERIDVERLRSAVS
ncbi:coiled-coil domain-containing protein [Streptomyces sp. AD55]|uniref:coiled-coil domain-containing protein n=1 Tax=Streptomyces sp. AD55 TaxID=3242895 RepID=UPI003527F1B2